MSFQSFQFLVFFVVVLVVANLAIRSDALRKLFLLAASYFFYACWDFRFAFLLLSLSLANFILGLRIERSADPGTRSWWLALAVTINLGTLAYFKYVNFFIDSFADLLALGGISVSIPALSVLLPLGISFYTFQHLSYVIDTYRRQIPAATNLSDFLLFSAYFPRIAAGPILRANDLLPQFQRAPQASDELVLQGTALMVRGFIKKIAFADIIGVHLVDPVFANPGAQSSLVLLLAVYAYSFQIYMDLSGYTDIARGASRCLGYELPINFRRPYQAVSVADFWQRWHITMSSFFRNYIFYALRGRGSVYGNLMLTFIAIGFWHAAGWNFILYGAVHGTLVCAEVLRRNRRRRKQRAELELAGWRKALRILWIFQLIAFVRILFRAEDLPAAAEFWRYLLTNWTAPVGSLAPVALLAFAMAVILHYVPPDLLRRPYDAYAKLPALAQAAGLCCIALLLVTLRSADAPFIYFQF